MQRLLAILALSWVATLWAESEPLQTFRSAREILALSRLKASLGYPVDIQATVTLAGDNTLFIEDSTAGIYVLTRGRQSVGKGDRIRIRGYTEEGKFAPQIHPVEVRKLGASRTPAPKRLPYDQLWNPQFECRYVEFEGTVRLVEKVGSRHQITFHTHGLQISGKVYASTDVNAPRSGDTVRARAVLGSVFNSKAQWLGPKLHIQSFSDLKVLRSVPDADSRLPLTPIRDLLRYNRDRPLLDRVQVRGVVTSAGAQGLVSIQDGESGVYLRNPGSNSITIGEAVEAIGFPALGGYSPILEDVKLRKLQTAASIVPLPITITEAESGKHDGRLVQMTGVLMLEEHSHARGPDAGRLMITVRDGEKLFTAEYYEPPGDLGVRVPIGSTIRITGVCRNTASPRYSENPFVLWMRVPGDLTVLELASWWTADRAKLLLIALLPGIAIGLIWLYILRRRLRRQTTIIQKQIRLETALEEKYRDLFENATDLVFTIDVGGRFTALNQAAAQTFGCTPEEGRRLLLETFVPEQDRPVLRDILAMLLGGERSVLRQMRIHSRSGDPLTLEMNCRLRLGNGGPSSIDIIARDVTQQKREKAELERARAAAEAASRAKSEFLANMSHEIRTPMNGILGMTDLTLETALTTDQRTNLNIVKRSAEALLTVINDILDFSKIEAGRMELERVPFDFPALVENCLDLVALPAESKGLELICEVDPTLPAEWIGDPPRLRQILTNLLGNAVKFTHRGEIVLRIDRIRTGPSTFRARFEVKDTGIGIPREQHQHIFGTFCQADGSTSRKYGGTGLGLAIAARLVALMGGVLEVSSAPGKGSSFSFTADLQSVRDTPMVPIGGAAGVRVRIADVSTTCARAIHRVLTHAGVPIADDDSASLVLTEKEFPSRVPLVLLLAPGKPVTVSEGVAAILRKPVSPRMLWKVIHELHHGATMLALKKLEAPVESLPPAVSSSPAPSPTILLAEDNRVNQLLAVRTLEKMGCKVLVANNGLEAVEVATASPIDLILMDIQMPEMDGFEATSRIQSICAARGRRPLPVIAMTAHALKGDRERCLGGGMTDYIAKPVRPGELVEMIRRYLPATA